MPRRFASSVVVLAVLAAAGAETAGASTFAGELGIPIPKGAQAEVRAISRADGRVTNTGTLGKTGRFTLTLPAGQYLVVGSVIPKRGKGKKVTEARVAVSLVAGQKRTKASLKARRRKASKKPARASYSQEGGQVTAGNVAVEIPNFTGLTGELSVLNNGITDMLISDVAGDGGGGGECDITVVESEHRQTLVNEAALSQSPYVDPSSRVTRNFVTGDVQVRGTLSGSPGSTTVTYDVRLIDTRSGGEVGRLSGSFDAADFAAGEAKLAQALNSELCKLTDVYEVRIHLDGRGEFASHTALGTLDATADAKRAGRGKVWTADGMYGWAGTTFIPKTECTVTAPVEPVVSWKVTLTATDAGVLRVEWTWADGDIVTGTVTCPLPRPVPVQGQPGESILNTGPTAFDLPPGGGTQTLSGGFEALGQGWFNNGTLTVTPKGVARIG